VEGFPKVGSEANNAHKEQIDGAGNARRPADFRPGIFHFAAPMDVIKYEDGILSRTFFAGMEVSYGRFVAVIAVKKYQIRRHHIQRQRECLVEISA
jgi:hypothetical protein